MRLTGDYIGLGVVTDSPPLPFMIMLQCFNYLWCVAMPKLVLSTATVHDLSCQNHKCREGMDGTAAESKLPRDADLWHVPSGV